MEYAHTVCIICRKQLMNRGSRKWAAATRDENNNENCTGGRHALDCNSTQKDDKEECNTDDEELEKASARTQLLRV